MTNVVSWADSSVADIQIRPRPHASGVWLRHLLMAGLLSWAASASAQQACMFPLWSDVEYGQQWTSTLSAVDVATRSIFPGYDPSTHPGVAIFPPATCTVISGNESQGTAGYTCLEAYTCGPPTCTVLQSGNVGASVQESCRTPFWVRAQQVGPCVTCSRNPVGDPLEPSATSMTRTEVDITFGGADALVFKRYYNSGAEFPSSLAPGWRSSYSRSVAVVLNSTPFKTYPGTDANTSTQLKSASDACVYGFQQIQYAVNAWYSATTTWDGYICHIQNGSTNLGTLQVFTSIPTQPAPAAVEYDVTRDNGELVRFPVIGGVPTTLPGVTLRLLVTANGFVVTDDKDTVETYDGTGRLLSVQMRTGVVQSVTYGPTGQISSISDSFGNTLTLGYDSQARLSTVTPTSGASAQFGYDTSGRLGTVTNLDSTSSTYVYENSSYPNALTGWLDESGTRVSTWSYDTSGRAVGSSEAGGANATTIVYNSLKIASVTDALGTTRSFSFARVGDRDLPAGISGSWCATCTDGASVSYDAAGFVNKRVDYDGNVSCYANDPARGLELVRVEGFAPYTACPSNLATYTPASGTRQRKISTTWSASFRLPATITEAIRTTSYTYDGSGNTLTKTVTDTTVTPNVARTWTYTYDSYGHVLTTDGPRTDVVDMTSYAYYSCTTGYQCGHVYTVTDAAGNVTTYNTYNSFGKPLTMTDANGVVTTLTYDLRQRLTSRQVGTETTTFSYWPTGLLKQVTLPDSSSVLYTYDAAHRLTQISDGAGNKITYTLDKMGNRTAESAYDPNSVLSRTRTRVFSALNQLYQEIGAANTAAVTTSFGYDSNGNQTTVSAPLSRNTTNAFDELNRLMQVTDPGNGVTKYQYDSNDNLTQVTDPRNLNTSYQYNGFGDVKQLTSPDTGVTSNTYDSGGNLATATDARSAISTYSYDALNRVTSVAYKVGSTTDQTVSYTYDAGTNGKGRLTGASDANHSMTWAYDGLGRVTSKGQTIGSVTKTVGYAYTNGDLTTLTTPSGQSVVYSYSNGQISGITINGATVLSSVAYEPFGPARGWTWGNATTEVRLHNTDGNPSQISAVESSSYAYDNAFRITGITNSSNGTLSWTYGFDLLDRLTSATETGATYGWTYDANGNRLTQTGTAAGTYTPSSSSNRLNSITGTPARTYSYDNAGDTLTYSNVTLAYNNRGRMKTATVGSATTTYLYNALGQRIQKSGGPAGTVLTVYDEAGHVEGEYTSTGVLVEETVWLGDTPVATIQPSGSSVAVYYVHADHLNAPRMITRPSDNKIAWRWDTDPFGTAAPNQNPQGLGTFVYNLRYPGQYYDSETGLNYNYYRDYDPQTGRYVESDPVGLKGGVNTYAYVGLSPVFFYDPDGLGKQGGQSSVGGDDPAIPKNINKNSSQAEINQAIKNAEAELSKPGINPARAAKIRGWIKVAKRGFTRGACPPLVEDLAMAVAHDACLAGNLNMCQVFIMLGGEIAPPGT